MLGEESGAAAIAEEGRWSGREGAAAARGEKGKRERLTGDFERREGEG